MSKLSRLLLTAAAAIALVGIALWFADVLGTDSNADADVTDTSPPAKSKIAQPKIPAETKPVTFVVPEDNRPIQKASDGFVSSDACRECHEDQFDSWHGSYHRKMTQLATPDSVIGDFSVGRVEAYGRDFVLSSNNGEFWVNMFDPDKPVTPTSTRIDRRIVMTTGSHHMQVYWFKTGVGREVGQLPVAWLKDTQEWVPQDSLFISPSPQPLKPSTGRWNTGCIRCHTTHGQPKFAGYGDPVTDTHVGEFGISCEACHGPGEDHVKFHRNGGQATDSSLVNQDSQRDIVHPGKLDHKLSSQVCGQCHSIWIEDSSQRYRDFMCSGRAFRAGDEIADHGHVFSAGNERSEYISKFLTGQPHYLEDRFWSDGMSRVSGSDFTGMMRSPCYKGGEISCMSCHQLHHDESSDISQAEWANDQLKDKAHGREGCLQCHEQFRDDSKLTAHTHHQVNSSGSDCYNCHMPHTTYGLLKAIRSHQISSPDTAATVEHGRPNACNLCHIDKSLGWTAGKLEEWYGIEQPAMSSDQKQFADTIIWSLSGDAGQRALAAASMGWQPAQEASRTDWCAGVLGQLMLDPYDAVRHVAHRSLRSYPEYSKVGFRYTGPAAGRQRVVGAIMKHWKSQAPKRAKSPDATVLVGEDGNVLRSEYVRLFKNRDNREVLLAE